MNTDKNNSVKEEKNPSGERARKGKTVKKLLRLDKAAVALRPVRANHKRNEFIYYEATTFPRNPYQGCELYLRRCNVFGFLVYGDDLLIDVLNADGDIIQDFPISKRGFEYLRGQLKFKRELEAA